MLFLAYRMTPSLRRPCVFYPIQHLLGKDRSTYLLQSLPIPLFSGCGPLFSDCVATKVNPSF